MPDQFPTQLGKYTLSKELGRGGFGVVYRAVDTKLNRRPVALKVLAPHLLFDPQAVARFQQEAGLAANLRHPNIVVIYDIGEEQGQYYLAMELIDGKSLAEILKGTGPLPLERVSNILRQLADALDYAHAQNVIHRDVKPSNILIGENDHVTLTDFGLARAAETSGLTTSGQTMGTPTYMAPEQLDPVDPKPADARSDLYALGIVVYEMLAGRPPFVGPTPAVVTGHLQTPPPPLMQFNPQLPEPVSHVVLKALEKDPAARYQVASAFSRALDETLADIVREAREQAEKQTKLEREEHDRRSRAQADERKRSLDATMARVVGTIAVIALLLFCFWVAASVFPRAPTPTPEPPTAIAKTTLVATTMPPIALPSLTPMATVVTTTPPTPTTVPPQAKAIQTVNLRQGPGTIFAIAGQMPKDTSAVVLGKNEDGKWLQVAFPDAAHPGWISATFATMTGSIDTLPVVAVALPPTSTPGGIAPTETAAAATETKPVLPPKGVLSFISYDSSQSSFVLNNLAVNNHAISEDRLLGPKPGSIDLNRSTNVPPFAVSLVNGRLAYVHSSNGLVDVLNVTDAGGNAHPLVSHGDASVPGGISSPTWSPDSSTVAYIGIDSDFTRQAIYKIDAGGGTESLFFAARSGEVLRGLAWGKTYFLFVSNLTGASEIWRLNSDGSGPLQLTNDKAEDGSPAWSPDGKQFAYYSKRTNGYQIIVANADGSGGHQLTNTANNWTPTWSPDGNWIAFASTRGGRLDVYIMDRIGGNVQLLTDKSAVEAFMPGSWR